MQLFADGSAQDRYSIKEIDTAMKNKFRGTKHTK